MCGIAGQLWGTRDAVRRALDAERHRGPDASAVAERGSLALGHARLAILDLDRRSDQPFERGGVLLSYNGELWNWRALRAELEALGEEFRTGGDTEVVAAALDRWGEDALPRLDGMFALAWTRSGEDVFLARDRFGEVPLHFALQRPFSFASELGALLAAGADPRAFEDVGPGEVVRVDASGARRRRWYFPPAAPAETTREEAAPRLRELLRASVRKRAISDVPVCALLSGGVDSGAVARFLKEEVPDLVAYTAVFDPKSADLRAARATAEALSLRLEEVRVEAPSAADLAAVVGVVEMPFKAQVEIGWACVRLAERIAADGFKVTFSGEGSDELWGSYGFAYHGLKKAGWHEYRRDLFLSQARKNFPRCNKVFMRRSIECRLPFLDPGLVEHALSLSREAVQDGRGRPKAVLQDALSGDLPEKVLSRPKVAFQDGMGLKAECERAVADPRRFYAAVYARSFGGARAAT